MESTASLHPVPSATSRLIAELTTSGISVGCATIVTNPIDVIKTRLQLQSRVPGGPKPPGLLRTGINIVQQDGPTGLFRGLPPALARGIFYGGLRLGMYSPTLERIAPRGQKVQLQHKVAAGVLAGGGAAAICSPTELIKTRLQQANSPYRTSMDVVRAVVQADGVVGLWRGALPGLLRASALTASQCATYDEVKREVLRRTGWPDDFQLHFTCSLITGLVTTTTTNPIDVVKTIMFVSGRQAGGGGGVLGCAADVWRRDGLPGFFKGWTANYARLGPQTMIVFVVAEQLRVMAGLRNL